MLPIVTDEDRACFGDERDSQDQVGLLETIVRHVAPATGWVPPEQRAS